jgi:threonine dehydratase
MAPAAEQTLISLDAIREAQRRLHGVATRTPLVRMEADGLAAPLYLKAESLQPIGSFKLRGAYNKISQLSREQLDRGVIAYSSGNHAQGVAFAARAMGAHATITMPSNTPAVKQAATRALGAEVVITQPGSIDRQVVAERLAAEHGYTIIPPYDDAQIIAGAATCGLEILEDMPDVDLVLVPVSGGGLISGIAAAIKQQRPAVKIVGVEPELAGDAAASLRAGHIISFTAEETGRTIADGLRTQQVGDLNWQHIRTFVDDIITVTEAEIRAGVRGILLQARLVAEPSGAVATAAALFHSHQLPAHTKAVAVVSGGNIEPAMLHQILGLS